MHFVEAKSLFLLLKSHKFFISAYIKNVDFASTKRIPRLIYSVKSRGSCSALYKNLGFSHSKSLSRCISSRRNRYFQSNVFSSVVLDCCSSGCSVMLLLLSILRGPSQKRLEDTNISEKIKWNSKKLMENYSSSEKVIEFQRRTK